MSGKAGAIPVHVSGLDGDEENEDELAELVGNYGDDFDSLERNYPPEVLDRFFDRTTTPWRRL